MWLPFFRKGGYMKIFKKGFHCVFDLLQYFAMTCMTVMVIIVFAQVVMRKIFGGGFSWADEVSTLMMVWFGFIGIAIGVLERIHMCLEVFTMKLPQKVINIIERVDYFLISIFGGLMVYYGIFIMNVTKMSTMPATKLPSAVLYVILPISGILIFLHGLFITLGIDEKLREGIKTGGSPDA